MNFFSKFSQCPAGISGDPFHGGCARSNIALTCDETHPCANEENCVVDNYFGKNVCVCKQGYVRDQKTDKVSEIVIS